MTSLLHDDLAVITLQHVGIHSIHDKLHSICLYS